LDNTSWQIGDGENINFWNDKWLTDSTIKLMSIPDHLQNSLSTSIKNFIHNGNWLIPSPLANNYSAIAAQTKDTIISLFPDKD